MGVDGEEARDGQTHRSTGIQTDGYREERVNVEFVNMSCPPLPSTSMYSHSMWTYLVYSSLSTRCMDTTGIECTARIGGCSCDTMRGMGEYVTVCALVHVNGWFGLNATVSHPCCSRELMYVSP